MVNIGVASGKGVSQAGMLEVVNFLIELERSAKPVAGLSAGVRQVSGDSSLG